MPSIVVVDGFRIVIYPNDHGPPHVHVLKPGWEAKLELGNCKDVAPHLIWITGKPTKAEIRRALQAVADHCEELLMAWKTIHEA